MSFGGVRVAWGWCNRPIKPNTPFSLLMEVEVYLTCLSLIHLNCRTIGAPYSNTTGHQLPTSHMSTNMSDSESTDSDGHSDNGPTTLADRLSDIHVNSKFPRQDPSVRFVPEGSLHDLIGKVDIEEILSEHSSGTELQDLTNFILSRAVKIFATLITCNTASVDIHKKMVLFKKHDFCDKKLPIQGLKPGKKHPLRSLSKPDWGVLNVGLFCEKQWTFLSPIFEAATPESPSNYNFEPRVILPFTERNDKGSARGSFGRVHQCRIHPKHLKDPGQQEVRYISNCHTGLSLTFNAQN